MIDLIYEILKGESADGQSSVEDFGTMCDELEKDLIKEEFYSVANDNEELDLKLGEVRSVKPDIIQLRRPRISRRR